MNNDLFISPGDPAFYFHHAQIDRVWMLWQGRDLARREKELMGTTTWFDSKLSLFPFSLLPMLALWSRSSASFFAVDLVILWG